GGVVSSCSRGKVSVGLGLGSTARNLQAFGSCSISLGPTSRGASASGLICLRPRSAAALAESSRSWPGVGHHVDSKLLVSQPARRAAASLGVWPDARSGGLGGG